MERTWDEFVSQAHSMLNGEAAKKGYNEAGPDARNPLYEFVEWVNGGPAHGVGEGIYKLVRYSKKRNPEDLAKLAAWAFLMWRHHK